MRVFLTEWFLRVPEPLRARHGGHDRGRKGHASHDQAKRHFDQLVRVGRQAMLTELAVERLSASGQHVELVQVETSAASLTQAIALLDDTWATPQPRATPDHPPLPWRADEQRMPWAHHRRVLEHWRPRFPSPTGEDHAQSDP